MNATAGETTAFFVTINDVVARPQIPSLSPFGLGLRNQVTLLARPPILSRRSRSVKVFSMLATLRYLTLISATTIAFALVDPAASASVSSTSGAGLHVSGGLINGGNTCYLNAQLECAYHIPRVRGM